MRPYKHSYVTYIRGGRGIASSLQYGIIGLIHRRRLWQIFFFM